MKKTFGNYRVCFEGHRAITVYAASFKAAVEQAMENINVFCAPFTGESLVTLRDLEIVFLP